MKASTLEDIFNKYPVSDLRVFSDVDQPTMKMHYLVISVAFQLNGQEYKDLFYCFPEVVDDELYLPVRINEGVASAVWQAQMVQDIAKEK